MTNFSTLLDLAAQEVWLRTSGWKRGDRGQWWFPRSTIPPLGTADAYKMGKMLEGLDDD